MDGLNMIQFPALLLKGEAYKWCHQLDLDKQEHERYILTSDEFTITFQEMFDFKTKYFYYLELKHLKQK